MQSAIAVVAAGKTIAEAIGDAFDKLEAAKQITPEENQVVKKVIKYKDDPKMMAGLQTCGQHGEIRHSIFDLLITPAYADAPSCKVTTPDGDILDLTPSLATLILNQIADRTKQVLAVTSFVTGMGYELLKGGLSAQTQRLDDGTTLTWTTYSFGTTVSTDVPLPGGGSISLSLTLHEESDGSFTLIGGQIGSTPMSTADLGDWANMMSRDGKKLVVYNQQSGSGSGNGTTTGGSVAATGSPDPDDDGNGGNSPKNNDAKQGITSLRSLHSSETITSGNASSYNYWSSQSTDSIVESLLNGDEPLLVKSDGTIMNGNTRILALQSRGYDVNSLIPRLGSGNIYSSQPMFPLD